MALSGRICLFFSPAMRPLFFLFVFCCYWSQSWAQEWTSLGQLTSNEYVSIHDCSIGPNGQLLLCGTFSQLTDLDPNVEKDSLIHSSPFGQKNFIMELDVGGEFNWINIIDNDFGHISSVCHDPYGGVIFGGSAGGYLDLEPGPGLKVVGTNQKQMGFVARWNSEFHADWVVQIIGKDQGVHFEPKIELLADSTVKIIAYHQFQIDRIFSGMDTLNIENLPSNTGFLILHLGIDGKILSYKSVGSLDDNGSISAYQYGHLNQGYFRLDEGGILYIGGEMRGSVELVIQGDSIVFPNDPLDLRRAYIMKLDSTDEIEWCHVFNSPGHCAVQHVISDGAGGAYGVGHFNDSIFFNYSGVDTFFVPGPNYEHFIFRISNEGNLIWARHLVANFIGSVDGYLTINKDEYDNLVLFGASFENIDLHDGNHIFRFLDTDEKATLFLR